MKGTVGPTRKGDAADLMRSAREAALAEELASAWAALRLQSLAEEPLMLGQGRLGRPEWTGCYALDWEILVYRQEQCWEACFFKGELHHEHLTALTLNDARSQAEERINSIKLNTLQSTITSNSVPQQVTTAVSSSNKKRRASKTRQRETALMSCERKGDVRMSVQNTAPEHLSPPRPLS